MRPQLYKVAKSIYLRQNGQTVSREYCEDWVYLFGYAYIPLGETLQTIISIVRKCVDQFHIVSKSKPSGGLFFDEVKEIMIAVINGKTPSEFSKDEWEQNLKNYCTLLPRIHAINDESFMYDYVNAFGLRHFPLSLLPNYSFVVNDKKRPPIVHEDANNFTSGQHVSTPTIPFKQIKMEE